mgnify:CR=1 FL=1
MQKKFDVVTISNRFTQVVRARTMPMSSHSYMHTAQDLQEYHILRASVGCTVVQVSENITRVVSSTGVVCLESGHHMVCTFRTIALAYNCETLAERAIRVMFHCDAACFNG